MLFIEPHCSLGTKLQGDTWLCRGRLCAGELELLCFPAFIFPAAIIGRMQTGGSHAVQECCSHGEHVPLPRILTQPQKYYLNPVYPATGLSAARVLLRGFCRSLSRRLSCQLCFPPLLSCFAVICSHMFLPSSGSSRLSLTSGCSHEQRAATSHVRKCSIIQHPERNYKFGLL